MSTDLNQEQQKWDAYYATLPLVEPDDATVRFHEELVGSIAAFLPSGGRVLEAGCGGGWQSLAMEETGGYEATMLDFSAEALRYASRVFSSRGRTPRVLAEDLTQPGRPEFDLVFNAGVLEHYTPGQQVELIRSMASRSRRYVLVLLPNARCYWYWLWRNHLAASDRWQWGKEIPLTGMRPLFEQAGLRFLGQRYFGASWTEYFIASLSGLPKELSEELLTIHRSPAIPEEQKAYLLGVLASVDARDPSPAGWSADVVGESRAIDELAAALADGTALAQGLRRENSQIRRRWAAGEFEGGDGEGSREEIRRLTGTVDSLGNEIERMRAAHESRVRGLQASLDEAVKALKASEQKRNADATYAEKLERLSGEVFEAGARYSAEMQSRLDLYRGQRAWTVMLAIRKAYTLLTRGGLGGWWKALKTPLELTGSPDAFREYELSFPDVWDFLPAVTPVAAAEQAAEPLSVRNRPDVLILPVFDFEFRFQRPQQLAARLAERGHRVWWVSPSRMLSTEEGKPFELTPLRERLTEVRIAGEKPELYAGQLSPAQAQQLIRSLQALYQDEAIAESVVLMQFPYWRQVALALRESNGARVVYDCMDDWQQWQAEPRISAFNLAEEERISREADLVMATSRQLQERLQQASGRKVLRVRNGADYAFFAAGSSNALIGGLPRPIVGYYGAIADWVDVELLTDLAASRPQYSFVVIGEVHEVDVSRLRSLPNVQMLGEKNYRLLPSYLWHFDACLLLFKQDRLTSAVDPVKVYEYLSQGKPVVATPLEELQRLGELLYFATNLEQAAEQLDRAVAEKDEETRKRRMEFARAESWQARAEAMMEELEASYPLVSIVVVSYNSEQFLLPCLQSIARNTSWPKYEVIVLDNASDDGSAAIAQEYASRDQRFRAVLSATNLGFAGGNNAAAREARGDYLVLLNADTIVTAGWVHRLLRPLLLPPGHDGPIGITTPVTNFSGNETRVLTDYRNISEMDEFAAARSASKQGELLELRMAALLCAAVPMALWNEAGGLDEKFGVGMFEDDDFSLRVKKAGYRVVSVEDCFIHHFGNGSFAALPSEKSQRLFDENRKYFEEKWKIEWQPHTSRPGVPPLGPEDRKPVGAFLQPRRRSASSRHQPRILALHPASARAGERFHVQPDGNSALVAECENATPATSVQFGDQLLSTSYGSGRLVSAIVPNELLRRPGRFPVRLVNDFGASEPAEFVVSE